MQYIVVDAVKLWLMFVRDKETYPWWPVYQNGAFCSIQGCQNQEKLLIFVVFIIV